MAPPGRARGVVTRTSGVWARLLGLVLIPSIGLSALVADEVVDRRAAAADADELAASVDDVTTTLDAFVAASEELRATGIVTGARQFGLSPAAVGELLGFDVEAYMAEARALVDESPVLATILDRSLGGRAALGAARDAVDNDPDANDQFHADLFRRALDAWEQEIDRVNALDADFLSTGALHQSMDSLGDAAVLYQYTQLQLVAAAETSVSGLYPPGDELPSLPDLAAMVRAAVEDFVSSADEHLAGAADYLERDHAFQDALDDLPAGLSPGTTFDVETTAAVFRTGLARNDTVVRITQLAAEDAHNHAIATGADARAGYHWSLAMLGAIIAATIGLSVLVARSIARPLRGLERRAAAISDGELDGDPIPERGPREAAVLARTLNEAVANLRQIERQATALATGDLAGASTAASHGKLSQMLQRSVDALALSLRERDDLQAQLRYDADHDALTGLANRRAAIALLDDVLAEPGPPVAVLFVDVDGLKLVNDTEGHAAGDEVLRATAARLVDTAPSGALVARLGGDEFVLAARLPTTDASIELAERIVSQLAAVIHLDGAPLRGGVSVGVALSTPGERAGDLLRWADLALYEAKRQGRGRAVLLDDALRAEVRGAQQLDDSLRAAIRADELELYYQPIIDIEAGAVAGVEALVRWRRDGELVPPDRFIAVAERTGTIDELDHWVLRQATAQVAAWRAGPLPNLWLAVNASARTLLSAGVVDSVAGALRESGLSAEALELEVTETAFLNDLDAAAANIAALGHLGVRTSIDDFGTGFTSISHLRRLPVRQIKIDQSFIAGLDDDRDRVLVDLVIRIGHVLGVEVVAEGVETRAQLEVLRQLGCELVQGYLLGRPVPADEVVDEVKAIARDFRAVSPSVS